MKLWKIFGCLPIVFFIFGCKEKENNAFKFSLNGSETVVSLVKIENNVFDIKAVTHLAGGENIVSVRRLNYPVYRFECADITGDGIPEIAVGVIKPNHLDPKPDKRLFLFKLYDGMYIRPLWLGSKLPYPLVDFRLPKTDAGYVIRTIEQSSQDKFNVTDYRIKSFGPATLKSIKKGAGRQEAQILLSD